MNKMATVQIRGWRVGRSLLFGGMTEPKVQGTLDSKARLKKKEGGKKKQKKKKRKKKPKQR